MKLFSVWIQHENKWKIFKSYWAEDGQSAIQKAREDEKLKEFFETDELEFVNMDYEDESESGLAVGES